MSPAPTAAESAAAAGRRIVSVTAELLIARPEHGVSFAIGRYDEFAMVLVRVTTADGLTGYGEALARRGGAMAKTAVEALLAPAVTGADAADIGGLWVTMFERLRRWGHAGGVVVEAISGVDTALWDLAGKRAGEPVWALLHGAGRARVPVYASSVYIDTEAAMVAQALEQRERGFGAIKVKIGRPAEEGGVRADLGALTAIREAVGAEVELYVDANGAYDAATAIRVGRALEELEVGWLEEPVPADDVDGYRRVHQMTATPLAAGESVFAAAGFQRLLAEGLIDYVQPDLGRCGGVTAAMQASTLCDVAGKAFAPHTGFSGGISHLAALHVAAAAPRLASLEYMFIDNPAREIFAAGYPEPEAGTLAVPDGPGLGLELDHERIASLVVAT
ncbi:MAG: mandelate racemase/muconate lactonizing enzyme family protein [Solirubrobacterales bacterium]